MSTVTEIHEAISQLNSHDRHLLMVQLFATMPEPDENDPELVAALKEGLADAEAGRVYSIDDVQAMIPQWISKSRSHKDP